MAHHRFFGREAVSFVVIFPIALPGVVTGMALSTTFATTSFPLGLAAIVVGHATFRYVTLPGVRTAILAGALLAFALSFDEVIVTIFVAGGVKTLPIWIFQSFRLANQVALVNVAGIVAILLSAFPVYLATRLTSDTGAAGRG